MIPPQQYQRGIQDEQGIIPQEIVHQYRNRVEERFQLGMIDQEVINSLIQDGLETTMAVRLVNALQYGINSNIETKTRDETLKQVWTYVWAIWVAYTFYSGNLADLTETVSGIAKVVIVISGALYWIVTKLKIY